MTRRGIVLFALMSVIWGIPYLFIRVAVAEISPATLVFARTAIAALILLPVALLRTDLRPVLARWRWVVAFAAIEIAIPWVFLASAEQQISSSLAGLLIAGVPLVGAVVAIVDGRLRSPRPDGPRRAARRDDRGRGDRRRRLRGLGRRGAAPGPRRGRLLRGRPGDPRPPPRRAALARGDGLSLGLAALVYAPFAALQWPAVTPSRGRARRRSRSSPSCAPPRRSSRSPRSSPRSARSGPR